MTWSPNCEKFIYVAKRKTSNESEGFEKFLEMENFGEKLQNVKEPIFCLIDVKTLKLELIQISLESNFIAQPAFIDNDSIVFMGIQVGAKKLGLTYIYCRPTAIYEMDLSSKSIGKSLNGQIFRYSC